MAQLKESYSKMKITVSLISGGNNNERDIMRNFYAGILEYYAQRSEYGQHGQKNIEWALGKRLGINLELSYDVDFKSCDIGVQFGAAKARENEHHVVRQNLAKSAQHIVYVETPLLGRKIVDKNRHDYFRIGVNGFVNSKGQFVPENKELDPARLEKIKTDLGIKFPGWKDHTHGPILIMLQLPGDASLRGQNHAEWLADTVAKIRSTTHRAIVIRTHPSMSDKARREFFSDLADMCMSNYNGITWSDGRSTDLSTDLKRAGIAISYSSGSVVDAVLAGVPSITVDQGSMAYPISEHRIENIKNPYIAPDYEVDEWLLKLSYSQWSTEEILNGTAWEHLLDIFIEQGLDVLKLPVWTEPPMETSIETNISENNDVSGNISS
jgi:hypothetical protein